MSTRPRNPLRIPVLALMTLSMAGCGQSPSPTASPEQPLQPSSRLRQYDPSSSFFQNIPYPEELTSIPDGNLQPLSCSPEYFSWSGADHAYLNPATGETQPISDPEIKAYLDSAIRLLPGKTIVSISLCEIAGGSNLVIFRAGPCGGGCAGIPNIAHGQPDGTLALIGEIPQDGDGPYYGCSVLQLTDSGQLYVSCVGEGTAIIRRVDLSEGEVSVVLRCEQALDRAGCG